MGSLLRATALWGYDDLVTELNGDPALLRERFDIPLGIELGAESFVPLHDYVGLLEATAAELSCPDFGMRLSHWQGLDILGPVAVIARNTPTLIEAIGSISRYLYVHSPALHLINDPDVDGSDLRFTYDVTELELNDLRQAYEVSMAIVVQILRLLGGPGAGPSSISFLHEQIGPNSAYAEALACPVSFGQTWCGFELSPELADRPIDSAHPETRRIAEAYLESQYPIGTATLTERTVELTRRLLPTGTCSIDAIADQLNLHPRTLQRRLAEEGAHCQDLIENERRDQAARYLAQPGLHLSQIAGLLGYAEQSTLNRSCRRWFGKTPSQFRSDLRSQSASR
ncbi:AraC-like DNA-binding protein [Aeromicrobium panaciterrae]|uniref:AraC-like DNA-binding protein n=1 Tax=Aeromicrobium panaciterrae TaxID=363861 RepID=A0ABU1UNE5_9ACTN|nr:AraC family transcriptional regulator [Aeromicrobium panaciterrae]MDR7086696.1 AraC-like DNA-binding protein [Aeromicrobium panaciterrae]